MVDVETPESIPLEAVVGVEDRKIEVTSPRQARNRG